MPRTARKAAILSNAEAAVPEIASEIAEGLHRVADSFETLAGVFAYIAAADLAETAGEQRQLAAVMVSTAKQRFGGVKYDGLRITDQNIEMLDTMWARFFNIDPKKMPRR